VNFVQKAVRLLWDGLDQIDPHESVGKVLWNNVGPSDLGEMAADMEMQKAFIGKKRPHSDTTQFFSNETYDYQGATRHRSSSSAMQVAAPPAKGLSPAPLFPTSVVAPNSQQMVSVNFSDDGHWAVQQAVKSVGDVQLWNRSNDIHHFSSEHHAQQNVVYQSQEQSHLLQVQPLQYHSEFTNPGFDHRQQQQQQQQQQQHYFHSDVSSTQPLSQPPNYSLAYVDYGVQPQGVAAEPNHHLPNVPTGVHIDPLPVVQNNLMEFNAMAQMYTSNPETHHPPNNSTEASMSYGHAFEPLAQEGQMENIRVVPLSRAEGSVILTGPQQSMYCTTTAQPMCVESMGHNLLFLDMTKVSQS
jgi:hypothetical protein